MTTEIIVAWLVALALQFAPPERSKQFPGYEETAQERTDRYAEIAKDIVAVTYDPTERTVAGMDRRSTAALMLALAIGESGLDLDVDRGPCYRKAPYRGRCDWGASVSIWQIKIGKGKTREGWDRKALFSDRRKAARVALRAVRGSFHACRRRPIEHRLALYGSGHSCAKAHAGSAKRIRLWRLMLGSQPVPRSAQ